MTNVPGISPGSSTPCAFSSEKRHPELWYLCPPTVHMSTMVTGGLGRIYQNISTRNEEEIVARYTNGGGEFCPVTGMSLLAKRYEYVQTLAGGRTAIVIQAKDTFMSNKLVAVKVFHAHNFLVGGQEADVHRQIEKADLDGSMPILRLLNTFRVDEHYCLVFDCCNPIPLNRYFQKKGWFGERSLEPIRVVATKLFQALRFLYKLGIIHADLKPENLLLKEELGFHGDSIRIIDFGNALRPEEIQVYEEDYDLQTLNYRAPEVIVGKSIGPAIDLWSVGCVLAELYLGKPIFHGETPVDVLKIMVDALGFLPHNYLQGKYGKEYASLIRHPDPVDSSNCDRYDDHPKESSSSDCTISLQHYLKCEDGPFVDRLAKLLSYNPEDRIAALEAQW